MAESPDVETVLFDHRAGYIAHNAGSVTIACACGKWTADMGGAHETHVAAALRSPTGGVTSVEGGCTCGGAAACPQCQDRDAADAPSPDVEPSVVILTDRELGGLSDAVYGTDCTFLDVVFQVQRIVSERLADRGAGLPETRDPASAWADYRSDHDPADLVAAHEAFMAGWATRDGAGLPEPSGLAKAWGEGFATAVEWDGAPMCRNPYQQEATP
jgi:hypothetical protein